MGKERFLESAARLLLRTCPAQARFLLWTLSNREGKNEDNVSKVCSYCCQFLFPSNYRMRLLPKKKITPQIEKNLNRERKNYRLNLKQTKLLKKYKESKNVLLITCNLCKKTRRYPGISREQFNLKTSSLKSEKSTPLSHRPSECKRRKSSGFRTSTSGLSTPCSSRMQNKAKILSNQLKKMLSFEENNKKRNLKNFLLSL